MEKALGRLIPPDDVHMQKYPLMAAAMPDKPVPITCGVNWYSAFDKPEKDKNGMWWVARDGNLGRLRGGHCVVMPHDTKADTYGWYKYYDQGQEGACVGFGASRMMSLLNRKRYDARWLYHEAQKVDMWEGGAYPGASPFYEGTSVRAAMDILRNVGHKVKGEPVMDEGIAVNRWATSVEQLYEVLQNPLYKKLGAIPFLNSWGQLKLTPSGWKGYPQKVYAPDEVWYRLMGEFGEFAIPVDR